MKIEELFSLTFYVNTTLVTVHPIVLSYPELELPPTNSISGIDLGPQLLFPNDFEIFHLWTLEKIEVLLFGSK